jgi:hypothetical protein
MITFCISKFRKDTLILVQTGNVNAKVVGNMRCLNRQKRHLVGLPNYRNDRVDET